MASDAAGHGGHPGMAAVHEVSAPSTVEPSAGVSIKGSRTEYRRASPCGPPAADPRRGKPTGVGLSARRVGPALMALVRGAPPPVFFSTRNVSSAQNQPAAACRGPRHHRHAPCDGPRDGQRPGRGVAPWHCRPRNCLNGPKAEAAGRAANPVKVEADADSRRNEEWFITGFQVDFYVIMIDAVKK